MITDEQKELLIQQYYDRGILKREIRSYEVSLWTLQDDFITVLKWSDVEQKGRIENPILTLNVDGTQHFTFSIPMYYRNGEKLVENPNWYTVKTGALIMGLRKLKIIFNKDSEYQIESEEVRSKIRSDNTFELLITKVTENHEEDQLICEVECEGLAFHELGKKGYKLSLSQDEFLLDKTEWDEWEDNANDEIHEQHWTKYNGELCTTEPQESVQYWCEEGCHLEPVPSDYSLMNPTQWYYDIQMNWKSFGSSPIRESNKVYEEEYVSAWTDELEPVDRESFREKLRPVEAKESNLYNITQTIAETFGIYCKYVYGYNDNYHIISRQIIFYNNYFDENNIVGFTYPYSTQQVSREMDATDVTTKMFVRPQDSDAVVSGQITIADCIANRTGEDYLLNFDYMYTCGAITKEQYDYIPEYEVKIRNCNTQISDYQAQIVAQQKIIDENEPLVAIYEKSIILDQESIDNNNLLYQNLDASDQITDGYFTRGAANPYSTYIKTDLSGRYFISLDSADKGIIPESILIFRYNNSAKTLFKERVENFTVVLDEFNQPSEIRLTGMNSGNIAFPLNVDYISVEMTNNGWDFDDVNDPQKDSLTSSSSMLVYLLYQSKPQLYYDAVNTAFAKKLNNDTIALNNAKTALTSANNKKEQIELALAQAISDKNALIKHFESWMGPALREGYWQPENYSDYGDKHNDTLVLDNIYNDAIMINSARRKDGNIVHYSNIGWDNELFDNENLNYYEIGINQDKIYYPCINISEMLPTIRAWLKAGKKPSFIFNNNYYKNLEPNERNLIQNVTIFALGSEMQLGFIVTSENVENKQIIPVLILTGTESMTDEQITFMKTLGNPQLGIVTTEVNNETVELTIENGSIQINNFLSNPSEYFIVYPRIKISSTELNTSSIAIRYNDILLNNYEDYEILSRNTTRVEINNLEDQEDDILRSYFEYFITIKPQTIIREGSIADNFKISYVLSNAATSIYLDALQVLQDSSKPRASYTVSVNALNVVYLNTLYKNLSQLVMINDSQLKFENVFGYISQLELHLDTPWEDTLEVKNYKTKFEDLFTTIVASSETMRQRAAAYEAAANGLVPLQEDAIVKMITGNSSILNMYLDTGLDSSAHLKAMLADIFTEAGDILATSNSALNDVHQLTLRNADILNGFIGNISKELTPKVVYSEEQPTVYNIGDIWYEVDQFGNIIGSHIATSNSNETATGYTKTYDGTLAQIKGTSLNVDAVTGKVEILAQQQIDMKSGGNIYIAANENVDIVGNKAVNIGGGRINIAGSSNNIDGDSTNYTAGYINIVSTALDFSKNANNSIEEQVNEAIRDTTGLVSKVLIHPEEISMASANILMRGTNSAISMSPDNGLWIGSKAGIQLYSGKVSFVENDDGTFEASGIGTNVELLPDHILFGVANTTNSNANAMKMTDEYIILAAGGQLHHDAWKANHSYTIDNIVVYRSIIYKCKTAHTSDTTFDDTKWEEYDADKDLAVTGAKTALIGAKFTKDSIGFATLTTSNNTDHINAILMNANGITLGSGTQDLNLSAATDSVGGSYVRISGQGIDIGSTAYLHVDTANLYINSKPANDSSTIFGLYYQVNSTKTPALEYKISSGLYVHGNIINDQIAIINTQGYSIDGKPYDPGIYLTNNSINGNAPAFYKNNTPYYAWNYNQQTYYIADNSGAQHEVTTNEVIYKYESDLRAVAPKWARAQEQVVASEGYKYIIYYITTNGKDPVLVNGEKVRYDGSASPNAKWYTSLSAAQKEVCANEYRSGSARLVTVDTSSSSSLVGKVMQRDINVTFSVAANTGYVTLTAGKLGDCNVNPQGITGGNIIGCTVTNTNLAGCTIEDGYNTGYYGRCFYDYNFNRDNGILILKRIDGTEEVIDIKTAVNVTTSGGSTGDSSGSNSSSSSGGAVEGCNGNCTGSCTTGCEGTCNQQCTTTCWKQCRQQCNDTCSNGCKGTCTRTCADDCTTTCASTCYGTCGGNCSGECTGDCTGGCSTGCTTACARGCASGCTTSCENSCALGCASTCAVKAGST